MRLSHLTLKNIRSYTEADIEFPNHLLLIGDIGSGKSTILQSIEFALFGAQRGLIDANHLLRNGEKEGSVELTFSIDDLGESNKISIYRSLKRKKTSVSQEVGYLEINGEKEEYMPSELRSRVLTLLGYPENNTKSNGLIYRYSVYATQEQMKSIILERPEVRLDTLRVIFGIDKYKNIIENAMTCMREMKKKIWFYEGIILDLTEKKAELADMKIKGKEFEEHHKKIELKYRNTRKDYETIVSQYELLQKKLSLLDIQKEKYDNINKNLEKLDQILLNNKSSLEELDEQIKVLMDRKSNIHIEESSISYDQITEKVNQQKDLITRNKQLKKNLEDKKEFHDTNMSELLEQKKKIEEDIKTLDLTQKSYQEIIQSEQKTVEELKQFEDIEKQKEQKNNILIQKRSYYNVKEKDRDSIIKLDDCPTCKQKVTPEHKEKISLQIEDEKKSLSEEIEVLEKELEKIEDKISLKKELDEKIQNLSKKKISYETKIADMQKVIQQKEDLDKKIATYNEETKKIQQKLQIVNQFNFIKEQEHLDILMKQEESLRKIELKKEQKKNLISLIDEKTKQMKHMLTEKSRHEKDKKQQLIEKDELLKYLQEYDRIQKEYLEIKQQLRQIKDDYEGILKEYERSDKDKEHLYLEIKKLEKIIADKNIAKEMKDWYEHIRSWLQQYYIPLLKKIERHVLQQIYMEFNVAFSRWFDLLIEDENIVVQIDEQFTPKIIQNGYDLDIDALSGGERTSVALAYRLALNKIVNELIGLQTKDILILDEPTEGFSTEQLDRVRDVILELKIPQLLVVSHEQKMDGFIEAVAKVEKEGSKSAIGFLS